ncbi:GNAT family N-acetyltransferase [Acholeplasma vituli]|uniref:GNAT family N-acetyltransferase n=1 Tax=Paracholeplasma vituli TaxID=69473 RepID=A0ABT2PV66_9MOLU|nr:GNAT family N-acetyltransferase [Paracholeplasma vituli]MCU0104846.1 GNAT family N-acetyltransferase [Paracholeplasma vituli]
MIFSQKMPTIELDKVILRTLLKKDANDFFELGKDPITTEFLTWGPFKTLKEAITMIKFTYFRRTSRNEPIGYAIVDKATAKMIGTIEFHTFNRKMNTCEIGYVLSRDYWNQGIMTDCLKAVTKVAFNHLKMDRVVIKHIIENTASQRVILKAGYQFVELSKKSFFHPKTQRFHDVNIYELWRNQK